MYPDIAGLSVCDNIVYTLQINQAYECRLVKLGMIRKEGHLIRLLKHNLFNLRLAFIGVLDTLFNIHAFAAD